MCMKRACAGVGARYRVTIGVGRSFWGLGLHDYTALLTLVCQSATRGSVAVKAVDHEATTIDQG